LTHSSINVDGRATRLAASLVLLSALTASPARAEVPSSARAMARSLFEQARALVAQEKYAEACPKFAESLRLDPAAGTQLNLAVCHEGEGKTATAWAEYNDALTQARRDGRPEREQFVAERLRALSPRLSWLTIEVGASADVTGLEVTFDGGAVGRAALGIASPADPGPHTVTARAPGHEPWTSDVRVAAAAGSRQTVTIPKLRAKPEDPAVAAAGGAASGTTSTTGATAPAPHDATADVAAEPRTARRTWGIVLAGTGAASVIVGSAFGVRALSQWSERNAACQNGCTAEGVARGDAAMDSAWIANIAIVAGLIGVGGGVYLVATSGGAPAPPPRVARVRAFPLISGNQAGLGLAGEWR
jgi:hypothetical protein